MKHIFNIKAAYLAAASVIIGIFAFGGSAFAATTTPTTETTASSSAVSIMVMKHLCNPNIKNLQDFENLEAGKSPIAALANTVLNCPTTGLVGNEAATGTVASPRMQYNFEVKGENGTDQTLTNANFMQHKLCESDVHLDVNSDGTTSPTTCLDISHYEFPNVQSSNGKIDVTETMPPAGFHFGAVRFTPTELSSNNDKDSLLSIDSTNGIIHLNTTGDTNKMVMLHIYNFQNASSTASTTTTTPPSITPTSTVPSFNFSGNLGWLVLPVDTYNRIFNPTTSSTTPRSPFSFVNGYPTVNGNYYDCSGNIDNDMGHHSTDPNDKDPGHHSGQQCPGGAPKVPQNSSDNNMNQNSMASFFMVQGSSNSQYVVIPLNSQALQKLVNFLMSNMP